MNADEISEKRSDQTVSKWLVAGQGFSLVVLVVSTALAFVVTTYRTGQYEQERFLKSRITALTVLRDEAVDNMGRAKDNVEEFKKNIHAISVRNTLRREPYPVPQTYSTSAWQAVSPTEAILTLNPRFYKSFSLMYGVIEDANRSYVAWEEKLLDFSFDTRAATSGELDAARRNRLRTLQSMLRKAEFVRDYLPRNINIAEVETTIAQGDLQATQRNLRFAWWVSLAILGYVALVLGFLGWRVFLELSRRARR